ncbi:GerW family sporulation protein [Thermoanaerobacterium sp. DL9XJH110]|uniref:GerW family sporulation protein n=1 Tax=Thermoanaerobacterium sp. DL9XJH110 TaxID=3386643 RepID=UPI003BB7D7BE
MVFKENEFFDEIIMGSPKIINGITFIPLMNVTFGCFDSFSFGFGCCISPRAFIVIDRDEKISFYNLISGENPLDILKNIS